MKLFFSSIAYLLLTTLMPVQAADLNNGKRLHTENCMRCHQAEIYTDEQRKVKSLEQLKQQVHQCELANDLGWFEEEVDDVTAYLNATYYLFGIK